MNTHRAVSLLLRTGVAFAFLFPALNAFFDPYSWIGYFPSFFEGILSDTVLLHLFGILEIIIGLWILSGRRIFIPSLLATLLLGVIVLFNLGDFQVLFRDLSIMTMALALTLLNRPHIKNDTLNT
jgi:uncharacterized membrane protein YphA (DoxX/SURF4 family)